MARRTSKGQSSAPEPDLFSSVAPAAAPEPQEPQGPPTYSVGDLTDQIAGHLENLGKVRVEGEVSGLKRAASGHVYFELKDSRARLSCAIWKGRATRMQLDDLREGSEVVAHGKLDVYRPRGSYSLIVEKLEPRGIGALLAQLEQLKRRLASEGRFERHRALPTMPKLVGVVTSRDGAALRDFLRTRSMRWSGYPVRLCHSVVQGPGSAAAIADSIRRLADSGVDVIVVTRGGGSIEDLWAFNEEVVLDAIWESPVPVISAVGHETDTTLADFQADHRAHTPTDAAQLVFPDRTELLEQLTRSGNYLVGAATRLVDSRVEALARLANRRELRDPSWILDDRQQRLNDRLARLNARMQLVASSASGRLGALATRLERQSPKARIERWEARLQRAGQRLTTSTERRLEASNSRMALAARGLESISPLRVLARGYSVTTRVDDGQNVRETAGLKPGDRVQTRVGKGSFEAEVTRVDAVPQGNASQDGDEARS